MGADWEWRAWRYELTWLLSTMLGSCVSSERMNIYSFNVQMYIQCGGWVLGDFAILCFFDWSVVFLLYFSFGLFAALGPFWSKRDILIVT